MKFALPLVELHFSYVPTGNGREKDCFGRGQLKSPGTRVCFTEGTVTRRMRGDRMSL